MYYRRTLSKAFAQALSLFPSVLVSGPRQSGKSTFVRHELGEKATYVSFDDPLQRSFADQDPQGFLDQFGTGPVILDEIQYCPDLLPYIKLHIDNDRGRKGKWILTGSQQFRLMEKTGETLAGRIAILELLPFSIAERPDMGASGADRRSLERVLWIGGYPDPVINPESRELWLSSYVQTYLERDVRNLINVKDLRTFGQFLALCASRHGQELNYADLSREIGISQPTVKGWISALEASFILFLLPPYHENLGKRIIKAPKLYFLDSALQAYLTRQNSPQYLVSGPGGGAAFEGLIVTELYKAFSAHNMKGTLFFWRSHDGLEVDLIINRANLLIPVEIKLSGTPREKHWESIELWKTLAGRKRSSTGYIVCTVEERQALPFGNFALPWSEAPEALASPSSRVRF
jgi:predicted AAA+ superfamily ATPase